MYKRQRWARGTRAVDVTLRHIGGEQVVRLLFLRLSQERVGMSTIDCGSSACRSFVVRVSFLSYRSFTPANKRGAVDQANTFMVGWLLIHRWCDPTEQISSCLHTYLVCRMLLLPSWLCPSITLDLARSPLPPPSQTVDYFSKPLHLKTQHGSRTPNLRPRPVAIVDRVEPVRRTATLLENVEKRRTHVGLCTGLHVEDRKLSQRGRTYLITGRSFMPLLGAR